MWNKLFFSYHPYVSLGQNCDTNILILCNLYHTNIYSHNSFETTQKDKKNGVDGRIQNFWYNINYSNSINFWRTKRKDYVSFFSSTLFSKHKNFK